MEGEASEAGELGPGEAAGAVDCEAQGWHHPGALDDLFKAKERWRPVLLTGALLFFALGLASLLEALRGEPLLLGEQVVAQRLEALCYRGGAVLLSLLAGGWLFALSRPPPDELDLSRRR